MPMNNKKNHLATVRVGPLGNIPATLRSLDHNPEPVFNKTGFKLSHFKNPDNRIPFIKGSKLLAQCVETTGCECFGLLLGMQSHPSELGVVGFLLRAAPDVKTALQILLDYLDLHDEGGVVTLETKSDITLLGYSIQLPEAQAMEQIYDLSIVMVCNIMRGLCGEKWKPTEVLLMRKPPKEQTPHHDFFQSPIQFNAERNAVAFPSKWLNQSLVMSDSLLFKYLLKEADELRAKQDIDLTTKLRQLLQQCLLQNECTLSNIALQLGIHERTLNRRLHEEGTTFTKELEQVRFAVSQQLLSMTNASLQDIAISLGYADSTVFIRAFKRWSNMTPTQWRNQ